MKVKYQSILYFLLFLVFIGVLYKIFCIKESFKDLNTLDIVDTLVKQESETNFDSLCDKFNKSNKIKFIFLRCRNISSWYCDTKYLWGPDIESEYIILKN